MKTIIRENMMSLKQVWNTMTPKQINSDNTFFFIFNFALFS